MWYIFATFLVVVVVVVVVVAAVVVVVVVAAVVVVFVVVVVAAVVVIFVVCLSLGTLRNNDEDVDVVKFDVRDTITWVGIYVLKICNANLQASSCYMAS